MSAVNYCARTSAVLNVLKTPNHPCMSDKSGCVQNQMIIPTHTNHTDINRLHIMAFSSVQAAKTAVRLDFVMKCP
jgi:hypothetical protein